MLGVKTWQSSSIPATPLARCPRQLFIQFLQLPAYHQPRERFGRRFERRSLVVKCSQVFSRAFRRSDGTVHGVFPERAPRPGKSSATRDSRRRRLPARTNSNFPWCWAKQAACFPVNSSQLLPSERRLHNGRFEDVGQGEEPLCVRVGFRVGFSDYPNGNFRENSGFRQFQNPLARGNGRRANEPFSALCDGGLEKNVFDTIRHDMNIFRRRTEQVAHQMGLP